MKSTVKIIYWLPRVLSILFVLFISLFALDVFNQYAGWGIVFPLFIHLIPSLVLAVVIAIAWKYEWVGAVIFFGFATFYLFSAGFNRPWSWYVAIVLPATIVGLLFLLSWQQRRSR